MADLLVELIRNSTKEIPSEYAEQALNYARNQVAGINYATRVKNHLRSFCKTEIIATAAGGVVGLLSGNMEDGLKNGALIGATSYSLDIITGWFLMQSRGWKEIPQDQRNLGVALMGIGDYFKRTENPLWESVKSAGATGVVLGAVGRPIVGDWNSILIGIVYGLGNSAYQIVKGHDTIDKIKNYGIVEGQTVHENVRSPSSVNLIK